MRAENIQYAARRIAEALHRGLRDKCLVRIDIDSVRCAIAGYLIGAGEQAETQDIEDLEKLTLRKIVEKV